MSLWGVLRFPADKFVNVLNTLNLVESIIADPEAFLREEGNLPYFQNEVKSLREQLMGIDLRMSAKTADRLHFWHNDSEARQPCGIGRACQAMH